MIIPIIKNHCLDLWFRFVYSWLPVNIISVLLVILHFSVKNNIPGKLKQRSIKGKRRKWQQNTSWLSNVWGMCSVFIAFEKLLIIVTLQIKEERRMVPFSVNHTHRQSKHGTSDVYHELQNIFMSLLFLLQWVQVKAFVRGLEAHQFTLQVLD